MLNQIVIFKLNDEEFCVDIMDVLEIIRMQTITKVPDVPSFVEGIINLRGTVIPIIDLKKRLKLKLTNYDDDTRIIIIKINEKSVGFIVDSVTEVLHVENDSIKEAPDIIAGIGKEYIESVVSYDDRLIINLDLEKILTESEKREIEEMQ
ncbi:MAG: purine-binding chemotaxis protein CheW [Thermoanaerobacterium sp.]|jgi:CheW-like domain.|uniref:chemotaxis protein CheW n=1 Tax=Thermoanaerobacterium thermosaccharolyticum TaxID=1517 RepID=UPI0024AC634E|nr:purine-binding chemotaxis protein CheW [Thermoanaerobacterium sp.]MDN5317502.1 purine-binding chemotaxis protein CheW [Thermoanaerobacterium sp.]WHE08292.1 chemotaxis protein CheW [Thermoanaerobacterium thermosaccharolyticum]